MLPTNCHVCDVPGELRGVEVSARSPDDVTPAAGYDRMAYICPTCFEALDVDMWSCKTHYESLNPKTPFTSLPFSDFGGQIIPPTPA